MTSANPFRAFVSYCHADAAFAARLQRQLESYRLPKRLADRVAPMPGQAQGRIGPVFRDRADLSAAQDLSAAVREAIALSSALIVVASPEAEHSIWVRREIELFRELHPGAPILVALIRGEPEESLPESLRVGDIEPLAADFRREGDGKRLAFLKIIAALLDLPLDAVVQRDAQRQIRRVTAITTGAVVMVVIMALLLVMALRAREEAERRRLAADTMINKLLTQVRGELEGTGNVKLMVAVNQLAIDYYGKQGALRQLADGSQAQRALVLHALGQDEAKRNRLDAALAKFTEAHRATAALLAENPKNPDAIFAHAQSEFYLGMVAQKRKDRRAAERYWRAYLRQAQALAAVEPGSARSSLEQGYAHGNLCDLNREDEHDLQTARSECESALRFDQEALARSSEGLMALANREGATGIVHFALKRYEDALANHHKEAGLLDPLLRANPRNVEYALRRSWADIGMANAWIATRRPAEAAVVLRQSLGRQGVAFPAHSEDWRVPETQLRTHLFLARALRDLGRPYEGELREARRYQALLAKFGPDYAAKATTIWTKFWSHQGGGK
jgi:tetratricopeptide (TPR) repeat protein